MARLKKIAFEVHRKGQLTPGGHVTEVVGLNKVVLTDTAYNMCRRRELKEYLHLLPGVKIVVIGDKILVWTPGRGIRPWVMTGILEPWRQQRSEGA